MTLFTSMRGRFLLTTLLWVTLGIGAIWYSSVRVFTQHVELQYHDELEVHVLELGRLTVLDSQGRPQLSRPLSDPRYEVPLSGFYWQVTRPGYGTIKSPSMTRGELDFKIARSPTIDHRLDGGPTGQTIVYGFVREVGNGPPLHFVIATDERHLERIVSTFTRELTILLTLLALALVICGLAMVTLGFRPFGRLSAAIERLREGSSSGIEGQFPDELQQLVADLNAYVTRNTEIVARGRVQASALAHSLRTPLAIITDEAEQMQEGPRPTAADTLLQQSERMQRQIDYHLARVRSGGTRMGVAARISLREILLPLLEAMRRCYPAKRFTVQVPDDFAVAMDEDDLSEVLENLLDNAGKWSRSEVKIVASGNRIMVCDDGPGIAPGRADLVFEIGEAAQDARGGSGLGLAISRSIMRDYGGDIVLGCGPEGYFCVQLMLAP
ncbi:HAMP domain-containing sensor histidine kinase [Novosphingobium aquae]|uniref:histidine kinase n=1 Tax=Novosphingobium aquae TaxID=3133435 RepID=A0ABU8S8U3_9SPHN